jgi:membrane protease YdiL (CAAX protease family)
LAYILPVLYAIPVYIACWSLVPHSCAFGDFATQVGTAFGFPGSPITATFLLGIPVFATFGAVRSIASALGEEIGWRGFLLPRLTGKFGWRIGCLVSGCIWAVWHYPLLLFADYNSGTPKAFALACFTLMVIADAYILGWLRLRSKSLWPCAMLHATHNLFIQGIFDRSTTQSGQALYVTTEFGFGLIITTAITAFILWRNSQPGQDSALSEATPAAA